MHIHEVFNIESKNSAIAQVGRDACEVYLTALQIEDKTGNELKPRSDRIKIVKNMDALRAVDMVDNYKVFIALMANLFALSIVFVLFNDRLSLAIDQHSGTIILSSFVFVTLGSYLLTNAIKNGIHKRVESITKEVSALNKEWKHISSRVDVDWWN
ncbi:hypothetical protein [Psychrobacter sp. UBA3480]|uniref:hypothetical protein n=1 Tax=Psychrobacter sp. UBA3480 TaxID=1947350 RepID=UPI0025D8925F|nr:hypothetical protein [Psychrobacter sp. UBA3480]